MATANLSHLIPVEHYLNTTYRPDVDYVDGELEERNVGEVDHGDLQFHVANLLRNRQGEWSWTWIPTAWIVDPENRTAHTVTDTGMTEQTTGTLRAEGTRIELGVEDIFRT